MYKYISKNKYLKIFDVVAEIHQENSQEFCTLKKFRRQFPLIPNSN